jgi:hypothetical protein
MGSEDGGDIDSALLAEGNGYACQPFVELDDDSAFLLVIDKLVGR